MTIFHRRHYLFPGKTSIQENYGNSENQTPQFVGSGPRRLGLLPNHPPSEIRSDHDRIQTAPGRMGRRQAMRRTRPADRGRLLPAKSTTRNRLRPVRPEKCDRRAGTRRQTLYGARRSAGFPGIALGRNFFRIHGTADRTTARPRPIGNGPELPENPAKFLAVSARGRPVVRRLHRRTGRRLRTMAQKTGRYAEYGFVLHADPAFRIQQGGRRRNRLAARPFRKSLYGRRQNPQEGRRHGHDRKPEKTGFARLPVSGLRPGSVRLQFLHARNGLRGHGLPPQVGRPGSNRAVHPPQNGPVPMHPAGALHHRNYPPLRP